MAHAVGPWHKDNLRTEQFINRTPDEMKNDDAHRALRRRRNQKPSEIKFILVTKLRDRDGKREGGGAL